MQLSCKKDKDLQIEKMVKCKFIISEFVEFFFSNKNID